MTWTRGKRELAFSGRLPLEQGAAFEQAIWNIAKPQRARDKQAGAVREWQQYTADALVTLARQSGGADGGVRRSPTTLIVHVSERWRRRCWKAQAPLSPETAERLVCDARRLTIQPSWAAISCIRASGAAPPTPSSARSHKRSDGHCHYPGCTAERELEAHHLTPGGARAARPSSTTSSCSAPATTQLLHDHHIRTSGSAEHARLRGSTLGRAITTNQPHAPPR